MQKVYPFILNLEHFLCFGNKIGSKGFQITSHKDLKVMIFAN